ncbi:MAG: hypothetical protein AAFV07_19345 [Bacteroidota bacterium]
MRNTSIPILIFLILGSCRLATTQSVPDPDSIAVSAIIEVANAEQAEKLVPIWQTRLQTLYSPDIGFSMNHLERRIELRIKADVDTSILKKVLTSTGKLELVETFIASEFLDSLMVMNEYVREHKLMEGKMPADSLDETYPLFSLLYLAYWVNTSMDIADAAYCRLTDRHILEQLIVEGGILPFLPPGGDLLWHKYPDYRIDSIHRKLIIAKRLPGTYWNLNDMMGGLSLVADKFWDPCIKIELKPPHHQTWSDITEDNIGRYLAVVLDGAVYSCPMVNERMETSFIPLILPNEAEAKVVAAIVSSAPIPKEINMSNVDIKVDRAAIHSH